MQKKMGMFVSFLFLCAVSLIGIGCSNNRSYDDSYSAPAWENSYGSADIVSEGYESAGFGSAELGFAEYGSMNIESQGPRMSIGQEQGPAQGSCSPCTAEPFCKILPQCKHPSQNELKCEDHIIVRARNPKMCMLGDQYPLDFDVHACDDVCDVIVTTHLPNGVSFIRSEPEAKVEGNKLTWDIGPMSKGECRAARVWLKCECEGEQCVCFCATAVPVRFCALLCAKPILVCEKCGPEQVCPGDPVHYTITVSNRGSCAAEEVVVTDNLPAELDHHSGQRTLHYKLGTLAPCETKTVNICATAIQRGKICNTVTVTACNADSTSCQWCTCICCCGIDIVKVGPKEVPIGKNADYQVTVSNTGDLPLTDVVVTDVAPSSTSIVSASGASVSGNQAVWRMRELAPGEKATFNITLTTCTPGCFTNKVSVTNCQNCNACTEYTTRWKGKPALNGCIQVSEDPICIGDPTSYSINVINQGSEADSNVKVVVRFPPEVTPRAVSGDTPGTISGQTVTFAPVENMRSRQTLNYRVDAVGKSSGDARIILEISSDSIKTPIVQQESTIVN
jgi:uncharacterized repeat protein (TIGR01451 family)